jgi:hypothetical protein
MKKILFFVMMMVAFGSKAQVDLYNGLIAYYPFDGNANDASGNGHNGTVNGASYASGVFGTAFTALSVGDGDIFTSEVLHKLEDEFSISFWFISYATSNAIIMDWVGTAIGTSDYDFFSFIYFAPQTAFRTELEKTYQAPGIACDNDFTDFANNLIPDPNFYANYTLVRKSDSIHVYLNNVKVSSTEASFPGCLTADTLKNIKLGSTFFSGEIDNMLIYNRALNISEVDSIYNLSSSLPAVTPSSSNQLLEKNVNIYPNPFVNLANINFPENGIYNIQVVDMTGRLIYTAQVSGQNLQVNTSSWAAGMYRLNIFNENGQFESKTIVKE